jgi:protein-S-isoprenylcysteine O-methyltransferase Ste14
MPSFVPTRPWDIVFLVGFVAYIVIRGIYQERAKGIERPVSRFDRKELALLVLVFLGCILLPVIYLFTNWLAFADYPLPPYFPWAGAAVLIAALWLFWRSHADLGQNWSATLELRKDHQLVRHGVYRSIRHPMYAAILLFGLAQGLLLQNWLAGWSGFVTFAVMYFVRVPNEEQMMCEFFGDEYRDYMRQSGRVIPRRRIKGKA